MRAVAARNKLRILALALGVVVLGLGAAAWSMWPSVEVIPEVLEEIDPEQSLADLVLEAQGPLEAVRIGDLRGKTVFLMIEGKESMTGGEGKQLRRALHRWTLPEDVVGFSVGAVPVGASIMSGMIERDFVGPMRGEVKLPVYIDYGGTFTEALSLPAGHLGFAIINPEGELVFRHAGDVDEAQLTKIKALLRAEEPSPGPPAPAFEVGELSNESCTGRACVLVFLDAKVLRNEIPGLEQGGFEGEMKEAFAQIKQPSIRLARVLVRDWPTDASEAIAGVIVGQAEGWSVAGWKLVAEADEARQTFAIGDEAGMVIIDGQGRVAFAERGLIPLWKLSLAADVLGIEPRSYGSREAHKSKN